LLQLNTLKYDSYSVPKSSRFTTAAAFDGRRLPGFVIAAPAPARTIVAPGLRNYYRALPAKRRPRQRRIAVSGGSKRQDAGRAAEMDVDKEETNDP
jgi:hypothetical protein